MSSRFTNRSLEHLLRQSPELRDRVALTCIRSDGAGSQLHGAFTALVAATALGVAYVHAPMRRMHHASGDPALWARRWEGFFNIGDGERQLSPDDHVVPLAEVPKFLAESGEPFVVNARNFSRIAHQRPSLMRRTADILRSRYDMGDRPPLASHAFASGLTVAIHIRKGDVLEKDRLHYRVTSAAQNLRAIACIRGALGDMLGGMNVYSQGFPEDFSAFSQADCVLHLDTDPFETFHNLVTADVLVTAKSSFSTMAGWLSNGTVVYEPYAHAPDRSWIVRKPDGGFAPNRLRRAVLPPTSFSQLAARLFRRSNQQPR